MNLENLIKRQNNNIKSSIETLSNLPYRNEPYSAKNWGHVRHTICSYPSKMKPSIAYYLVSLFSNPGDTVLDPFSGVGTIPFEASLNGRVGIGLDLSPLAFNVTNSKLHKMNERKIFEIISSLKSKIRTTNDVELLECEAKEYYHEDTYKEILIAKEFFSSLSESPEKSFVLSCLLHILHGNRPYALSRRSHNIIPIPPKGEFIYKSLIISLSDKVNAMLKVPLPFEFREGYAFLGDATKIPLENESISSIITSPPFLGTTDFLRQNRIRLWFLGWDKEVLSAKKKHSNFLEYNKLSLYPSIFSEFYRLLQTDGIVVMHLGIYKKFDMASSLKPILEEKGFEYMGLVNEDSGHLKTYGRTDRGGTHTHQFLVMRKMK